MVKIDFRICFGLLVLCVCLGGCSDIGDEGGAVQYSVEKNYRSGPLEVWVRFSNVEISIAETLEVEITAAVEAGYEVTMGDLSEVVEGFDVIDWRKLDEQLDDAGRVVQTYRYRLEPMVDGVVEIGELVFGYSKEGEAGEVRSEAMEVMVVSTLGENAALEVIDDIAGVVEVKDWRMYYWIGGGLIVVVILVAVLLYRRSRRVGEAVRVFKAAHELAYERLAELEAKGLVGSGRLKEFYEGLCGVLRYYIEDRFALKAPERTTEEFLYELAYSYVLSDADKESVGQFLRDCDLVKFAKQEPTDEQVSGSVKLITGFVDRTHSDESVVEVF